MVREEDWGWKSKRWVRRRVVVGRKVEYVKRVRKAWVEIVVLD